MLEKLSTSQRKFINYVGLIVMIGIGFMLIKPSSTTLTSPNTTSHVNYQPAQSESESHYAVAMATELELILSQMAGVGEVDVFVTLERGPKIVVAQQLTEEHNQSQQQTRSTSTPVTLRLDGEKKEVPLVLEEYEPVLRGVLVIAEGAQQPDVRYKIFLATQTVLQIPGYKIEVLPRGD